MTFAGANLAESEFASVVFNSSAGTAQAFTMATRDLRATAITVTDSTSTTELIAGALNLSLFDSLTVGASGMLTMDAATASNFSFDATTGTITLTAWTIHDAVGSVDIQWTFNPGTAGDTITMTFGGLSNNTNYDLRRDTALVSSQQSNGSGSVTFIVAGGWSSHAMQVVNTPVGGGPPPTEPPTEPLVAVAEAAVTPLAIALYVLAAGAGLFAFSRVLKAGKMKDRLKFYGIMAMAAGGLIALYLVLP